MIQVYGRFDGYWSHSQVSRGIVRGLVHHGVPLRIFNVAARGYDDLDDLDPEVGHDGAAAVGFYIGGYPPMSQTWLSGHPHKAALFITESAAIPGSWIGIADACDFIAVPSRWAARAYKGRRGSIVVPHGLDPVYRTPSGRVRQRLAAREGASPGTLVYGHMAGAASFLERKGTELLIEAFCEVFHPGEAQLVIRCPKHANTVGLKKGTPDGLVHLDFGFGTVTPKIMRDWYEALDFLVQPSRAEAFGICPLEARALGVPVILSDCTGHRDHICAPDVAIFAGPIGRIAVNGIQKGQAPTISKDAIVSALQTSRLGVKVLSREALRHAKGYYTKWSWLAVTEELAHSLGQLLKRARKRLGAKGLDEKLGAS